jgi:hypothetical protein
MELSSTSRLLWLLYTFHLFLAHPASIEVDYK